MVPLVIGIIILVVIIVLWYIATYNRLVNLQQTVKNSWSQIDVQLKRRHDLIPNLVETVKGYAAHERETLEAVIKARQMAVDAKSMEDRQQAENMLTSTLRSLFAVAEAYPNLKANENFMMLQEELAGTENKIAFARQHYNDVVAVYNALIKSIPASIVANNGGFTEEKFFEIESGDREVPSVSF
ncbi:MAG TPA: LemA family protein [Armatimonadota bacterium]